MITSYKKETSLQKLLWLLLSPWVSQQLRHFWIPKEPDQLSDRPQKGLLSQICWTAAKHMGFLLRESLGEKKSWLCFQKIMPSNDENQTKNMVSH